MKKKNILNYLQSKYEEENKTKKNNLYSCIPNLEECVRDYIIPYLENEIRPFEFDFEFDLNSQDILVKYKSYWLLKETNKYFFEMVSYTPTYFNNIKDHKGVKIACYDICSKVLYNNIYSLKKELKGLKTDDETITNYLKNIEEYCIEDI